MATNQLSHDEFFEKLAALFHARKGSDHGAIYLTQKRLSYGQEMLSATAENPLADLHASKPLPVIIRATNGKSKKARSSKIKLSTVVQPDDLESFYSRYAEVCKAGMVALKPRDRSKKKAKAKRKKAAALTSAGNNDIE